MTNIATFKGSYCTGLFIEHPALVPALALVFEKIYLPSNMALVRRFARKYLVRTNLGEDVLDIVTVSSDTDEDPFPDLTHEQRISAYSYLFAGTTFALNYARLYPDVFETDMFKHGHPLQVTLLKKGGPGEKNLYQVSPAAMELHLDETDPFGGLVKEGYVPVVGRYDKALPIDAIDVIGKAKHLAAILAVKSVEICLPATKPVPADLIIEAREKLGDHLPAFWASMLRLSARLKSLAREGCPADKIADEAADIVDCHVRPATIELGRKMELERKNWFYRILSPVVRQMRIIASTPLISQDQLILSAMALGAEVAGATVAQLSAVESMQSQAGLTYLVQLDKLIQAAKG